MANLSLSLVEIIVLMLGAIVLGITIHFIIVSRRGLKLSSLEPGKTNKEIEQWKLRYFNDVELRDRELTSLKKRLADTEENNNINSIEADEMRKMNKKLQSEMETLRTTTPIEAEEMRKMNKKLQSEIELLRTTTPLEADEMRKMNEKLQSEIEMLRTSTPIEADEMRKMNKKLQSEIELLRTTTPIEADEMRKMNEKLQSEIELLRSATPATEKPGYIEQLRQAQGSLMEHTERINQLLGQIDIVKETEEKQLEILKSNEELSCQIEELKSILSQKEREINNIHKKEHLTNEMTSMLDSAYNEFNVLQDKIQKLESQVTLSKKINLEYEDLKEVQYKISRDFEEQKIKYNAILAENQQLQANLMQATDKLKDANFQRQQLEKKIAYLEELNNDMQSVADAYKRLEGQLKRMGELESMLNVVAEERDELAKKQTKTS